MFYCADCPDKPKVEIEHEETGNQWGWRKKIGRFLPRWASRTTLEVISIRIDRLGDISEDDSIAEGCISTAVINKTGDDYVGEYARESFMNLWQSLNGPGSWDLNPWVWVVEFKTLKIARSQI